MEKNLSPRIYIACLASYNNGILHGAWADPTLGIQALHDALTEILSTSSMKDAEEWAIHDYEGFGGVPISEYESLDHVADLAEFIEQYGMLGAALLSDHYDLENAKRAINENYAGSFESVADFAQELTEDSIDIPERLRFYIDYDAMARDMLVNDILAIELSYRDVHVFWQH